MRWTARPRAWRSTSSVIAARRGACTTRSPKAPAPGTRCSTSLRRVEEPRIAHAVPGKNPTDGAVGPQLGDLSVERGQQAGIALVDGIADVALDEGLGERLVGLGQHDLELPF